MFMPKQFKISSTAILWTNILSSHKSWTSQLNLFWKNLFDFWRLTEKRWANKMILKRNEILFHSIVWIFISSLPTSCRCTLYSVSRNAPIMTDHYRKVAIWELTLECETVFWLRNKLIGVTLPLQLNDLITTTYAFVIIATVFFVLSWSLDEEQGREKDSRCRVETQ